MSIAASPDIDSLLLDRVIAGRGTPMPRAVAQEVLQWGFSEDDHLRMNELAARNREGRVSPAEEQELSNYIRVGQILGILQSKARRSLQSHVPPSTKKRRKS